MYASIWQCFKPKLTRWHQLPYEMVTRCLDMSYAFWDFVQHLDLTSHNSCVPFQGLHPSKAVFKDQMRHRGMTRLPHFEGSFICSLHILLFLSRKESTQIIPRTIPQIFRRTQSTKVLCWPCPSKVAAPKFSHGYCLQPGKNIRGLY